MRSRIVSFALLSLVLAGVPAIAQAQVFITPYMGSSFNSSVDDYDFGSKLHYGASVTWLSGIGIGVEADFAFAPSFFEPGDDEFLQFDNTGNLTTVMGNVVLGGASGLYVSGGLGLIRSRVEAVDELLEFSDNGFGMNVGGGLRIGTQRFGIKGDVRYFRQLNDLELFETFELGGLSFWRASVGASFGF